MAEETSPTHSADEFERLRNSAADEEQKTFEQRFQDIFGQQQESTPGGEPHEEGQETAQGEEEEEFIYDGLDVKPFDEDDEQEQIELGKDYATKLDEILRSNELPHHHHHHHHHHQKQSTPSSGGASTPENHSHNQTSPPPQVILSDTKTNGNDHPPLDSFIELSESESGSAGSSIVKTSLQITKLPQSGNGQHETDQSPSSPLVVVAPNVSVST
jgi:hypothetical protein